MPEARPIQHLTPLADVPGIPAPVARTLADMGVTNVGRLLAYLPTRHERQEAEADIDRIVPGQLASARGEITAIRRAGKGRKVRVEAVLMDETGRLDLVWFNAAYMVSRIEPGMRVRVQGDARRRGPGLQMANPKMTIVRDGAEPATLEERLRPVYPATADITSQQIEKAVRVILEPALALLEDHLPEDFRKTHSLVGLADAYRGMHAPTADEHTTSGRRRLAYDELLLLQLGVQIKRAQLRHKTKAPALKHTAAIDRHIRARLPFALTPSQESVVAEVARDLSGEVPANRLIQGDVGSGKTAVAAYAMLLAVASGHQAAFMAPTTLLAEQQHASISSMLEGSKVRVLLLTGSMPAREREDARRALAEGKADIVFGTHALLTEDVRFKSLAVAIVDEQHRFGVHQRARLRAKGEDEATTPHVLVMTATPIPRTLAITLFGDLDISTIEKPPPGRKPIKTRVVGREMRGEVYRFVLERLEKGEQAYVVCPAVGGDEEEKPLVESGEQLAALELTDVASLAAELRATHLAGKRLAEIHGRLKPDARVEIMRNFRAGKIDALIATTVIEVGVDVQNATVMVVENADRFGLSQLHQLRGRVGRGTKGGACILVGEPRTEEAKQRLEVIAATSDGFKLAERDLEIRGTGDVFGTRQAGAPSFRVADLMRDRNLLALARRDAAAWIEKSPLLDRPDERLVLKRLLKAHGKFLGLGDVG
jgi:ATP-dependent DNA helicase RecG